MSLSELYQYADENGINIYDFCLPETQSCSIQLEDDACAIGIDYKQVKSSADEKSKLAHEVGHCVRGAFYNRHSRFDLISRHEYRADKWACENLISKDEMERAFREGYVEVWQLAEYFDVTEDLVKKALWIYFDKEV